MGVPSPPRGMECHGVRDERSLKDCGAGENTLAVLRRSRQPTKCAHGVAAGNTNNHQLTTARRARFVCFVVFHSGSAILKLPTQNSKGAMRSSASKRSICLGCNKKSRRGRLFLLNDGIICLTDEAHEFCTHACIIAEGSEDRGGDGDGVLLFNAAHHHAEVGAVHHHTNAFCACNFLDGLGNIFR